nr:transmembrane protein 68 isoform X1 [Equus asinus]
MPYTVKCLTCINSFKPYNIIDRFSVLFPFYSFPMRKLENREVVICPRHARKLGRRARIQPQMSGSHNLLLCSVLCGYEVHGMEKIPEDGPALIIFYHGAIPIDFYYFMAKIFIQKGRTCRVVADHFVFKIPGFSLLLDVFCALHGPREKCVEILRSGHLLAISPGGVREALISDETYNIVWGNRKGFAQVAIDAKVPIIPMFTQNIREGFRSLGGTRFFRWLYEKFRYPFAPMYGGFPVKLRTYLGDPIPYDPKITAEELAEKTKNAVQALIDEHQRIPGNIMSALLERFHKKQKIN